MLETGDQDFHVFHLFSNDLANHRRDDMDAYLFDFDKDFEK
jgi:hypothetical protein